MPHSETERLQIIVNGEPRTVPAGLTVLTLLGELGIAPDRVAVELNRVIVRQPHWGEALIDGGARVEIVHFVGGG